MSSLRGDAVRVSVPATSANLGPGFDSLGLALDLRDDLIAMVSEDPGVLVEVTGEGCEDVPLDESHLVVQAMAAGFTWLGIRPTGFVLRCTNVIPHGRGLGSSAAAIVGGIVLARAMVDDGPARMSDDDVLQLALTFESHPDNLAAAIYGGFTIAWLNDDGSAEAVRLDAHPEVRPQVLVPQSSVLTRSARAALPATVAFDDASFNVARASLLVHALTADPSKLLTATADRLHQQARSSVYPASVALVERLRSAGVAAVVSGAGPSVLAFLSPETESRIGDAVPEAWRSLHLEISGRGAHEIPVPLVH